MPLIPIRLKELTPTSGKPKDKRRYEEPLGKRMSPTGKGNTKAKESHGEQP
jgi:hypothetical protein